MKWYFDTEFDDDGTAVGLISIGIVGEDGREYYAVSNEFDPDHCCEWVQKNVLTKLLPMNQRKSKAQIRADILAMIPPSSKPEFWAYFADYDWVVFCQIFGTMMQLPDGYPMFCMDLKQLMHMSGIDRRNVPPQPEGTEHNALDDARWVKTALEYLGGAKAA